MSCIREFSLTRIKNFSHSKPSLRGEKRKRRNHIEPQPYWAVSGTKASKKRATTEILNVENIEEGESSESKRYSDKIM